MRRRGLTFLSITVLAISLLAATTTPSPARAAVDLRVCGRVSAYVPATAVTVGVLTIGAIPMTVAAGTSLSSRVVAGANLCFALELNGLGSITGATVTANATATLDLCGVVAAYARSDSDSTGSLAIADRTLVIARGASLPAAVKVGANLCLHLVLNGFGQVQGGSATANATTTVRVCGVVTAVARAGSRASGSLAIGGRHFVLAIGSRLPASVVVGKDLCLTLKLNALGQVSDGTATLNVETSVEACGRVSGFVAATATQAGRLAFAGVEREILAGVRVPAQVMAGAFLRLRLNVDVFGRVAHVTVLSAGASLAQACGAAAGPSPSASPGASGEPSASPGAGGSPGPDADASPGAGASGAASPTASALEGTVSNAGCNGGAAAPADVAGGTGGIIPDTASLARAGEVLATTALPLLLMILGVAGIAIAGNRRKVAS
jgi:hypothetical protein